MKKITIKTKQIKITDNVIFDCEKSRFIDPYGDKHVNTMCAILNSEIDGKCITWGHNHKTGEHFALLNNKPFMMTRTDSGMDTLILNNALELDLHQSDFFNLRVLYALNVQSVSLSYSNVEELYIPRCKKIRNYSDKLKVLSAPGMENIPEEGFQNAESLEFLDIKNCKSIGRYAFRHAPRLKSISAPNVKIIDFYAFEEVPNLEFLDIKNCKEIVSGSFGLASKLKYLNAPKLEHIGCGVFRYAKSLETVDIQNAQIIGESAFGDCTSLKELYLKKTQEIDKYAFRNAKNLEKVYAPNCKTILEDAFGNAVNMKTFFAPNCEELGNYALEKAKNLETVCFDKLLKKYKDNPENILISQLVANGVKFINRDNKPVSVENEARGNNITSAAQFNKMIQNMRQKTFDKQQ